MTQKNSTHSMCNSFFHFQFFVGPNKLYLSRCSSVGFRNFGTAWVAFCLLFLDANLTCMSATTKAWSESSRVPVNVVRCFWYCSFKYHWSEYSLAVRAFAVLTPLRSKMCGSRAAICGQLRSWFLKPGVHGDKFVSQAKINNSCRFCLCCSLKSSNVEVEVL